MPAVVPLKDKEIYEFKALSDGKSANRGTVREVYRFLRGSASSRDSGPFDAVKTLKARYYEEIRPYVPSKHEWHDETLNLWLQLIAR